MARHSIIRACSWLYSQRVVDATQDMLAFPVARMRILKRALYDTTFLSKVDAACTGTTNKHHRQIVRDVIKLANDAVRRTDMFDETTTCVCVERFPMGDDLGRAVEGSPVMTALRNGYLSAVDCLHIAASRVIKEEVWRWVDIICHWDGLYSRREAIVLREINTKLSLICGQRVQLPPGDTWLIAFFIFDCYRYLDVNCPDEVFELQMLYDGSVYGSVDFISWYIIEMLSWVNAGGVVPIMNPIFGVLCWEVVQDFVEATVEYDVGPFTPGIILPTTILQANAFSTQLELAKVYCKMTGTDIQELVALSCFVLFFGKEDSGHVCAASPYDQLHPRCDNDFLRGAVASHGRPLCKKWVECAVAAAFVFGVVSPMRRVFLVVDIINKVESLSPDAKLAFLENVTINSIESISYACGKNTQFPRQMIRWYKECKDMLKRADADADAGAGAV